MKMSIKCGLGETKCEHYSSNNESHCLLYSDRRLCAKSKRHVKRQSRHSKIQAAERGA